MNTSIDRRIAVIGLGSMGGAMADTLHRTGWQVTGFDPSEAARAAAEARGIATVTDASALAGTSYVVLSLPSAAIVEATVPGLFSVPGTVAIVDTTTSEPATSTAMAALSESNGAAFVDAPVSGGRDGAATGSLSAFVGASETALAASEHVQNELTG
jgi:3-hydroxyisobutyrate dehydrogenase